MKKPTKTQFILFSLLIMGIIAILWSLLWNVHFTGDTIDKGVTEFGAFHIIFNLITIASWFAIVVTLCSEFDKSNSNFEKFYREEYDDNEKFNTTFKKKWIIWPLVILFLFLLFGWTKSWFLQGADMYNKSKIYHNNYTQKVQEKAGFYDKLWKTRKSWIL